ncbi:glycosyltransferase [Winogradskyella sp. DF17]|uniref:Glycosyltransferase n=1 Tax=Winogradskyella pelagia TaxID=2819984 RepID=A0ABS3T1T9_9FLAO|nr:glycosyltransferase [Winogradskyella sp. DF17]MBO3116692.1 glycosyltransferase [Winogradskyella sp. DF17]
MNILIVNTFDKGGAANACLRLHQGLLQEGVDAKVLLKHKEKSLTETYQFQPTKKKKSILQRLKQKCFSALRFLGIYKTQKFRDQEFLNSREAGLELFSFPQSDFDITTSPLYKEADIINLHWVAGFLDYASFFKKNTKPVVWTLHDMNPFTGGEHYKETILGMDASGHPIQRCIPENEMCIAEKNLSLKMAALSNVNNLHLVSLCQWMTNEISKSPLFRDYPVSLIPNGIDSDIFQPRNKVHFREVLNIPQDKTFILFVADSIHNHRKGYAFLEHALSKLQSDDVVLCAVGNKADDIEPMVNTIELGAIKDEQRMSMVYASADVFVIPSLMDNLPNTVIESLLCGTPVIGFPVGGITDMVIDGENGLLTKAISSESLLATIKQFLETKHTFNRARIREEAYRKYGLQVQTKAYMKLFKDILK